MGELAQVAASGTGGTPVRDVDYTYDALNRLTVETVAGATSTTYIYDDVGNRLAKDVCSDDPLVCETTTYEYNANNQLVAETAPDEAISYFYDTNGSLIEKSVDDGTAVATTTYAYDSRNRMTGAETPDDDLAFAYDVDGIRVAKTVNGVATSFLIDKVQPYAQVVEERNGAGSLVASYTYGNDLVSQSRGASTAYYAYDGLGSTRALTDASGAVTDSYTYDAFGTTTAESGTTENAYRFTGEQFEPGLQLYYLRARYYDPAAGRFGVMDEWGGNAKLPLTLNRYLYADGNPVVFVDPSGRFANLISISISMGVVGALSSVARPAFGFATFLGDRFEVDGWMQYVQQQQPNGCWAATAAMMMSWMNHKQYGNPSYFEMDGLTGYESGTPEAAALGELPEFEYWFHKWARNQKLDWDEAPEFWLDVGLLEYSTASRTGHDIALWLKLYGPLVIERPRDLWTTHYSIIKGVNGNRLHVLDSETGESTCVSIADIVDWNRMWHL